jgi:hypothetical protein
MSATLSDLIGQIIHPSPRPYRSAETPSYGAQQEPLEVLIGRIVNPPWAPATLVSVRLVAPPAR